MNLFLTFRVPLIGGLRFILPRLSRKGCWAVCLVAIGALGPSVSAADSSEPEEDRWTFRTTVDARLRYEGVDDDAVPDNANATTLRTRLSFSATRLHLFGTLLEFEDVSTIGSERFNNTANGKTNFAVVADPEATEINRAWLSYVAPRAIDLKLGRQRVNRDRGRIIGDVGWRQNQQTFDGVTAERGEGKYRFWAGYLVRANRIFGDQHPDPVLRQFELDAWMGEAALHLPAGTFTGVAQYIEFENEPLRSHRNLGLRWVGTRRLDPTQRIVYRAEWIDQAPYANGGTGNDAEYLAAEVGYETKRWGAGAKLEQLGGDGTYGFQRPLATLHAYNGWADRFLVTPPQGLVDVFADSRVSVKDFVFFLQYHHFDSDTGGLHYGDELDLAVSRRFGGRLKVMLKYASYVADDVGADVRKLWLSIRIAEHFDFR